jgi:hypothetical protein
VRKSIRALYPVSDLKECHWGYTHHDRAIEVDPVKDLQDGRTDCFVLQQAEALMFVMLVMLGERTTMSVFHAHSVKVEICAL